MVRQKQNLNIDASSPSTSLNAQIVNTGFKAPVQKSGQLIQTVQSSVQKRSDKLINAIELQNNEKEDKKRNLKRKSVHIEEVINLDNLPDEFLSICVSNKTNEKIREYDRNRKIPRKQMSEEQRKTERVLDSIRRERIKNNGLYLNAAVFDTSVISVYKLGELNVKCNHCPAIHFPEEQSKTKGANEFFECCNYGKFSNLEDMIPEYPMELRVLFQPEFDYNSYTKIGDFHKNFKKILRMLNSSFSCASLGCMKFNFPDKSVPIFKIQGSVYHSYNLFAQPNNDELPTNGQLYFIDTDQAIDFRLNALGNNVNDDPNNNTIALVTYIENYLRKNYVYSHAYEMMKDVYESAMEEAKQNNVIIPDITMLFDIKEGVDLRRYNIPRSNEVCAIIWKDANDDIPAANIIVHIKGNKKLKTIYPLSPMVEPMCYPIFYPNNYQGWHYNLKNTENKRISLCDFTKYKLFFRIEGNFLPHHYSNKLFQQWCVDQAARIEWSRLNYIRLHQKEICKETYNAIDKFIYAKAAETEAQVKKKIILPSSFNGGPRNMHESFMDAMAIVNEVGRPDLFLTFTCNPKDTDILKSLLAGQQSFDRPDIVARIFNLKVIQFLKEIIDGKIFGKIAGYCYTIEFQKRGLPHLHMLLTLDSVNKWKNTDDIDKFISAEIPNENEDKDLYDLVTALMIHGPCGPDFPNAMCWCQKKKKCSKKFPKQFREKTEINENGYPLYKRPNNGKIFKKKDWKTGRCKAMTNQDIVPYNRYLLKRFRSHINIEKVADIKAVKYIYKYIFKGYDAATLRCITTENGNVKELIYDEAGSYLDARYLSPVEACWKIFKFPLQAKSHSVQRLPVHLENEQIIFFEEDDDEEAIIEKRDKKSKLMAFFEFFSENHGMPEFLYPEMPKYCVWNSKQGKWLLRKNPEISKTIGRMYPISPTDGEKYYLRYLLLHIHGKSFEDLKTVDGITYNTFAKACLARGLTKNDDEWKHCLNEASMFRFPAALRSLFVSILLFGDPKHPENLWEEFKNNLAEDFLVNNPANIAYILALSRINKNLIQEGKSLTDFKNLPQEIFLTNNEENINYEEESKIADNLYNFMNNDQKSIFELIRQIALGQIKQKLIYIDGPGGTGKSFILNALYHLVRSHKKQMTNMAFSGIASTLLKNGRTIHNRFKFPLNLNAHTISGVVKGTKASEEIIKSDFFVIDEAPMTPRFALDAIEKKLRELTNCNQLFGGKTIILAGDFRQTLPVKKLAIRSEIIDLTIKKSIFWNKFEQMKLTINIRAINKIFADQILEIGNGTFGDQIRLPSECILATDSNLIDEIYGDIFINHNFNELKNRLILSPYNDLVDHHNTKALENFPGECVSYQSIDEVETTDNFPITPEIMNSFNAPGFPLHELKLKQNCKIMLLRNISIENWLCNGTILQVLELKNNLLRCIILGGDKDGTEAYIHRISLITETEFPVPLKRHQFPVRLAFAATFIKGQGSTYKKIGIDWTRQSFSHGQTYVALSRVGSWQQIKVKLSPENENAKIDNIVWKEIL